jgi:NAD(P)-dependent dehydrogenase (short-subunit alcohol dehydrogenase family)
MSRTVIVTGAGSGIGAAIARAFAAQDDVVVACDISAERLQQVAPDLGSQARTVTLDVSDEAAVRAAVREAHEETGRLDVIVNNAGVGDGKPDFVDIDSALWRRVLDINLSGCFYGAQEAARIMVPQGSGRIINMASISSFSARPNGVPYTVAKAGIFGLTQRMAYELAPHGITVNAIVPGAITTGIGSTTTEVLGDLFPATNHGLVAADELRFLVPMARRGSAEEVAAAVVFLASEGASYVTGVMLPVDGGWLVT